MSAAVQQLGYLGFEVKDLAAWERFAVGVLGLSVSRRDARGLALRLDGHAHRLFVTEGPADDLAFVGWQVAGDAELDALAARLRDRGVAVTEGDAALSEARAVRRLLCFTDPAGNPTELFVDPAPAVEPFRSEVVRGGFVADDAGLGHLVLSTRSQAESRAFYEDLLSFRLSDRIVTEVYGFHVDIVFMHTNGRHHSVAFGDQQKKRLHHFMLEARSIDDVGLAMDRTRAAGLRIMQTLGRHPNDRMLSFYAKTPSGFQFEFGWGGRVVDDATHDASVTYDQISEWGHHPPEFVNPPRKEERR
ncbi:MAG: VOC family protein [Polyangiaceae bacterium]|nr:VOC family protein [Polyangiaceae bacterium]